MLPSKLEPYTILKASGLVTKSALSKETEACQQSFAVEGAGQATGPVTGAAESVFQLPSCGWFPPTPVGEPPVIPGGAVIANAVFAAVGARDTELPLTPERVRRAMQARA